MKYNTNILDLFRNAINQDRAKYIQDWMIYWSYQDDDWNAGKVDTTVKFYEFHNYSGPQELGDWMNWSKDPKPDFFQPNTIDPLIEKAIRFDQRVVQSNNIKCEFEICEPVIARNNAQDYLMANAYPMSGPSHSRRVLDFGAGSGRQACLWNQMEDDGLVFIGVDGIPKSYCLQHFYYSNFDRPFFDYILNPSDFSLDEKSRGIYHIPTWRFDLIPDNYLDRVLAVQVLPELSETLLRYVISQFQRILKPTGALYVRDHKDLWQPVHKLNIDTIISDSGFTKEFEAHVEDKVDFFGIPRIFRKTNPKVKTKP